MAEEEEPRLPALDVLVPDDWNLWSQRRQWRWLTTHHEARAEQAILEEVVGGGRNDALQFIRRMALHRFWIRRRMHQQLTVQGYTAELERASVPEDTVQNPYERLLLKSEVDRYRVFLTELLAYSASTLRLRPREMEIFAHNTLVPRFLDPSGPHKFFPFEDEQQERALEDVLIANASSDFVRLAWRVRRLLRGTEPGGPTVPIQEILESDEVHMPISPFSMVRIDDVNAVDNTEEGNTLAYMFFQRSRPTLLMHLVNRLEYEIILRLTQQDPEQDNAVTFFAGGMRILQRGQSAVFIRHELAPETVDAPMNRVLETMAQLVASWRLSNSIMDEQSILARGGDDEEEARRARRAWQLGRLDLLELAAQRQTRLFPVRRRRRQEDDGDDDDAVAISPVVGDRLDRISSVLVIMQIIVPGEETRRIEIGQRFIRPGLQPGQIGRWPVQTVRVPRAMISNAIITDQPPPPPLPSIDMSLEVDDRAETAPIVTPVKARPIKTLRIFRRGKQPNAIRRLPMKRQIERRVTKVQKAPRPHMFAYKSPRVTVALKSPRPFSEMTEEAQERVREFLATHTPQIEASSVSENEQEDEASKLLKATVQVLFDRGSRTLNRKIVARAQPSAILFGLDFEELPKLPIRGFSLHIKLDTGTSDEDFIQIFLDKRLDRNSFQRFGGSARLWICAYGLNSSKDTLVAARWGAFRPKPRPRPQDQDEERTKAQHRRAERLTDDALQRIARKSSRLALWPWERDTKDDSYLAFISAPRKRKGRPPPQRNTLRADERIQWQEYPSPKGKKFWSQLARETPSIETFWTSVQVIRAGRADLEDWDLSQDTFDEGSSEERAQVIRRRELSSAQSIQVLEEQVQELGREAGEKIDKIRISWIDEGTRKRTTRTIEDKNITVEQPARLLVTSDLPASSSLTTESLADLSMREHLACERSPDLDNYVEVRTRSTPMQKFVAALDPAETSLAVRFYHSGSSLEPFTTVELDLRNPSSDGGTAATKWCIPVDRMDTIEKARLIVRNEAGYVLCKPITL